MEQSNVNSAVATAEFEDDREIRQLQLANLPDFPLREFLSISGARVGRRLIGHFLPYYLAVSELLRTFVPKHQEQCQKG